MLAVLPNCDLQPGTNYIQIYDPPHYPPINVYRHGMQITPSMKVLYYCGLACIITTVHVVLDSYGRSS